MSIQIQACLLLSFVGDLPSKLIRVLLVRPACDRLVSLTSHHSLYRMLIASFWAFTWEADAWKAAGGGLVAGQAQHETGVCAPPEQRLDGRHHGGQLLGQGLAPPQPRHGILQMHSSL